MMSRQVVFSTLIWLASLPFIAAVLGYALMWGIHRWNPPTWLVVIVGGGASAILPVIALRAARRWTASQFRFSLRSMLIAMAVVALFIPTVGRWWFDFFGQQLALRNVRRHAGHVREDLESGGRKNVLFDVFKFDPFENDRYLVLRSDLAVAEVLARPNRFTNFVGLSFSRGVTPAAFADAEKFNELPNVRLAEFHLTPNHGDGLRNLTKWKTVNFLLFNDSPMVTDAGLADLIEMPQLRNLALFEGKGKGKGMVITDAGLVQIGKMRQLKYLCLMYLTQVTDAGLAALQNLTDLETLRIENLGATEAGVRGLYAALPNCEIITDILVPGPANVRQIVVRRLGQPDKPIAIVTDRDQIAAAREFLNAIQKGGDGRLASRTDEPWPAEFTLEFVGQSRVLYLWRWRANELQVSFSMADHTRSWSKYRIGDQFQQHLLSLTKASDAVAPHADTNRGE